MRRAGVLALALVVALLGSVAVVLFFQARDDSTFEGPEHAEAPGEPYGGEPTLSPALEDAVGLGNVVILHRGARPPKGVEELQQGAEPELRSEGLAVLTEPEPTLREPLAAVSRERIQYAAEPGELRGFVDHWLGRR